MPELPDVAVYVERLDAFVTGREIEGLRVISPSLVKTFDPPVRSVIGKRVLGFRRIGKRIVWELDDDLFVVLHLMIAGRLRWRARLAKLARKRTHAAFDFEHGSLVLTEASSHKRASLHVVRGADALREFERGGLDVFAVASPAASQGVRSWGTAVILRRETARPGSRSPRGRAPPCAMPRPAPGPP